MPSKWTLLITLTLILAACGTVASPVWEVSSSAAVAQVNTPQPTVIPPTNTMLPPTATLTVTPLPPTPTIMPTQPPAPTDSPEAASAGEPASDAANGEVLFNTFQPDAGFACATCHRADSEDRLIGPGLLNIGTRAESRVAGQSGLEYIRTSIIDPGAYVVDTFPDGLMPQNWAEIYTEGEINDIIAYLLTL